MDAVLGKKSYFFSLKMQNHPPNQDFSPATASNLKERDLLAGLKRKEEWAYRQLIDQWSDKMFQVAYRFLGKKEDAEEIVQEVLQKVLEKIETFQGASFLYTWLYRIAVNQALMRLRTVKGKEFVSWEELLPSYEHGIRTQPLGDWFRVPEDLLAQKEVQDFLGQCIDQLPEDLKPAYLLKDVEGLSEEEVCGILELTKPTMKNRVHRARLILREQMEKNMSVKTLTMKLMFRMMRLPTCQEVEEFAYDFLDGKLEEKTLRAVEKHLRFCKSCRRFIESYRRIRAAGFLRKAPALDPEFKEKMFQFLAQKR